MINRNSKTVKLLIINNDDELIPKLESRIKSFGFNISVNTIRSFSELDNLAFRKTYDAFILTEFDLQTSDLISYVSKLENLKLSFLIIISKKHPLIITDFSKYSFNGSCFTFPLDPFLFRLGLERLVKGEKSNLSMTEQIDWTKGMDKFIKVEGNGDLRIDLLKDLKNIQTSSSKRFGYSILLIGILIFTIIFTGKWFFLIYICLGILLFIVTQLLKLSKAKRWIGDFILSILIWPVMMIFWDTFFKAIKFTKRKTYLDEFYSIPGMKQISDYFEIMSKDGTTEDVIPNGIGRFGYDATNPIPTSNVYASNAYLGRIRDKNGNPIRYERLGSASAPNIKNLIDRYRLTDASGNEICVLYISPYQKTISQKAPEGFTLK